MNAAPKLDMTRGLMAARVRLREGDRFIVTPEGDGGPELTARRARGCLLCPEPGDLVLVAEPSGTSERYILSVLEGVPERRAHIGVDGDAVVTSTGKLSFLSQSMDFNTESATFFAKRVVAAGGAAAARFDKLSVFSRAYELIAESFLSRVERAYRFVEQYDQLRAQHIDHRAESTAQIRAETTVVTARQVIKLDGESVHIG